MKRKYCFGVATTMVLSMLTYSLRSTPLVAEDQFTGDDIINMSVNDSFWILRSGPTKVTSTDMRSLLHASEQKMSDIRMEATSSVVSILKDETVTHRKEGPIPIAIDIIGELKLEEAVHHLRDHLTYVAPCFVKDETNLPESEYYPAIRALVSCGTASFSLATEIIEDEQSSPLERQLAAYVIFRVFHKTLDGGGLDDRLRIPDDSVARPMAITFFETHSKRTELTAKQRQQMMEARDFVKKFEFKFEPPPIFKNMAAGKRTGDKNIDGDATSDPKWISHVKKIRPFQ